MKKLLPLVLLASPAFAHSVPFNDADFLRMTGGNVTAAHDLSYYCGFNGIPKAECLKTFSGTGNLQQEAARKCVQRRQQLQITYKFPNGAEIPGSRATYISGTELPHSDLQPDEDGVLHSHKMSEQNRQAGANLAEKQQLDLEIARVVGNKGTSATTHGKTVGGSGEFGTSGPVHVVIGLEAGANDSLTINSPLLDAAAKKRIEDAKKYGYNNPEEYGVKASILCRTTEEKCRKGMGWGEKNPDYDPKAKEEAEKRKKAKEKEKDSKDKKGAENPPKHEDDSVPDVPEVIESTDGGTWAGGPEMDPDTMIATPVMDAEYLPETAMEKCVEKETDFLMKQIASGSEDPNGALSKKEEEERAKSLLQFGYCHEGVMGEAFCAQKRFQEQSTATVNLVGDRLEKAKLGAEKLKIGICDPQLLGYETCKKHKEKWIKTPAGTNPGFLDEKGLLDGVKLPKPGETPKVLD